MINLKIKIINYNDSITVQSTYAVFMQSAAASKLQ